MFNKRKKKEKILIDKLDSLNKNLLENNIADLSRLLLDRKKLLVTNLIAGIARGVGVGIGVTIISAILVVILRRIVSLNIPVIGEYITDIVTIVQKSM